MARHADSEETLDLLVASFGDALAYGGVPEIHQAALVVADHVNERKAVGVLWHALDAIGPEAATRLERLALGRRLFEIYAREGDIDGQWRIACRLLLSEGTVEAGRMLLHQMMEALSPADEEAWDHAYYTLQSYLDSGEPVRWDAADHLLEVSRRHPA